MIRKRSRTLLLVLLCSTAMLFTRSPVRGVEGRHSFEGQCDRCHLNEPRADVKLLFVKDVDLLCKECHQKNGRELSHPSVLKPSFPLPPEMQIDWSGKMTCITCHQTHGSRKYLLVNEKTGKAFCLSCHQSSLLAKDKYGHEVIASQIHQSQQEMTVPIQRLDEESQECLSCHDGGFTDIQNVTLGSGFLSHNNKDGFSHPIGVDYQQAMKKGEYKGMAALNKNMRFFNGKLGCGSCHNIYSSMPAKLVTSNNGSTLCLECHIK